MMPDNLTWEVLQEDTEQYTRRPWEVLHDSRSPRGRSSAWRGTYSSSRAHIQPSIRLGGNEKGADTNINPPQIQLGTELPVHGQQGSTHLGLPSGSQGSARAPLRGEGSSSGTEPAPNCCPHGHAFQPGRLRQPWRGGSGTAYMSYLDREPS